MDTTNIKNVAIYLRKSRDEDTIADVLSKHRTTLVNLSKEKEWDYTIYEESTISGDELITRPILMGLLQKIEELPDLYDAIVVMDYDRLSRGDSADFSKIKRLLIYAHVNLVTTESIYDLSRSGDSMLLGVKSVVASSELTQTKKRFREGKNASAKRGKFCNGDAPFPYIKKYIYTDRNGIKIKHLTNETDDEYRARIFKLVENKQAKIDFEIVVDEERREVYNFIKNSFLYEKMSLTKIVQSLNKNNTPTMYQEKYPDSKWAITTIRRILENRVHCGVFCFNKRTHKYLPLSNKHIVVNNNEDDWIIGNGSHEVLKTEEEHQLIISLLNQNEDFPKRQVEGKFTFSSLIYCKKCGRAMIFQKNNRPNKDGIIYYYVACHRALIPKCKQKGCRVDDNFDNEIIKRIKKTLAKKININTTNNDNSENIQKNINKISIDIKKHENALSKIKRAYEEDLYTTLEYKEAKIYRDDELLKLYKQIDILKKQQYTVNSEIDYKKILFYLENDFQLLKPYKKNIFFKSFIKKISYDRNDTINIEIEYK